jgi:transaldolase
VTSPASVNARLERITQLGTSVWLDEIHRELIDEGELRRMIDEDCLRGVTTNPAIFEKAIGGSAEYDEQIRRLAADGLDAHAIYQEIAIADVRDACDVLRSVYDETDGLDGYVSLEVDPDLAFDTERTIEQARDYWRRVDRPNLMIKIPGTDEGLPAITRCLAEGINVNVTLLFKVAQYEKVIEAWLDGLERRRAEGLPLDVHSVASFFVSRVDTEVDKRLGDAHPELHGKAGIANARWAYRSFLKMTAGERWAALRDAGAPVQRPLWASTGVKNPAYPPVLYVDELVGPDTVNTMPMATLAAVREQSEATEVRATVDPSETLAALERAGIDLDDVTDQLLREGVDKFITPMQKLLETIEEKRHAFVT